MSNTKVCIIGTRPTGVAVARPCQATGLGYYQVDAQPQALTMARMIREDAPDLTGGIRFVASDRDASYFDSRAWQTYLRGVFDRMGWTPPHRPPPCWSTGRMPPALRHSPSAFRRSDQTPGSPVRGRPVSGSPADQDARKVGSRYSSSPVHQDLHGAHA